MSIYVQSKSGKIEGTVKLTNYRIRTEILRVLETDGE